MTQSEPRDLFRAKYRIQSARLRRRDYTSAGLYFITVCVKDREPCLAEITNGAVRLSPIGEIVAEEWQKTEHIRTNVVLDAWVIMPNHLHGIIGITESLPGNAVETFRRNVSTKNAPRLKPNSLGSIIGQFKSVCAKRIWTEGHRDFAWQARFYDHVARNEHDLSRIRAYITDNPSHWESDRDNLENLWI
jgi:putative transposase